MAMLQADKAIFYHPCDSLVDGSGVTWTNDVFTGPGIFVSGQVVSGFKNPDTGDVEVDMGIGGTQYADNTGSDRVTYAFWGHNIVNSSAQVQVGFLNNAGTNTQRLMMNTDGISGLVNLFLGSAAADITWSIPLVGSGWHFYVMDFTRTGGDWILRHSVDGAAFTTEDGVTEAAFGSSPHEITRIGSRQGSSQQTTADEVALWRDANIFTTLELQNLYSLGNVLDVGLDQYTQQSFSTSVSASGDLFVSGPSGVSASGDLFIIAYDTIQASGDLFLLGNQQITTSGNLFIQGTVVSSQSGSAPLFIFAPPPDVLDSIELYIAGPITTTASGDLFISGPVIVPSSLGDQGRQLDFLIRAPDHSPQIIGTFATTAVSVNIQVWDVVDAANTALVLVDSGCYAIGNTGRWGWSTADLPSNSGVARHYFYVMTSNEAETFDGQFVLDVPEGEKWIYPRNNSDFLKQV